MHAYPFQSIPPPPGGNAPLPTFLKFWNDSWNTFGIERSCSSIFFLISTVSKLCSSKVALVFGTRKSLLGLSLESRVGGAEQSYCFSPDNWQQGVMHELVHYHVVTYKSVLSTGVASSWILLPSNTLKLLYNTPYSLSDHMEQIHDESTLSSQKKNTTNITFGVWQTHPGFFLSRWSFSHSLRRMCLHFDIISVHPHLIPCYNVFDEVSSALAWSSSSWLMLIQFSFWSSDNKYGTNFAEMESMFSFPVNILCHKPTLIPNSLEIWHTVKQRSLSILLSLTDVEGRPGLGFSLVDVLPALKWVNQS